MAGAQVLGEMFIFRFELQEKWCKVQERGHSSCSTSRLLPNVMDLPVDASRVVAFFAFSCCYFNY